MDGKEVSNSRVPLLQLPNELLCAVIADVALLEPPVPKDDDMDIDLNQRSKHNQRGKTLGFIRLIEVCRRFHALLLSMPTLWATIAFRLPLEPARTAILRAQSAPLTAKDIFGDLVALAVENAGRLGTLKLWDQDARKLRQLCTVSLSMLKDLDLQCMFTLPPPTPHNRIDICIDAPALQRARFMFSSQRGIPLVYNGRSGLQFKMPYLRSLDINMLHVPPETDIDDWIVDVLENCSLLESFWLALDPSVQNIPWDAIFNKRAVRLLHLESLELTGGRAEDVVGFYTRICTTRPARLAINITGAVNVNDNEVVSKLNRVFGSIFQCPAWDGCFIRIHAMGIDLIVEFGMYPAVENPGRAIPHDMSEFCKLSITLSSRRSQHSQIMASILSPAFMPGVITQLIFQEPVQSAISFNFLPYTSFCPAVTSLVIRHDQNDGGWPWVCVFETPDVFPQLDAVWVTPFVVAKGRSEFSTWWRELVERLKQRDAAGHRLRRLYIAGSTILSWRQVEDGDLARKLLLEAAEFVDEVIDDRVRFAYKCGCC